MNVKRIETWAIAVIFIALISIPLIVFVTGTRPETNQNRPPTPVPQVSASGILNRELTPQIDAYLEDALIITPGAVAAEAWTDVALGDNPNEEVTLGTNGWLYYTFSLTRSCLSNQEVVAIADAIDRAEQVVAATGRELVIAIAPDKASIIPDFLTEPPVCVERNAQQLGALDEPDALVTVWDEMRTARARERPIYFRLDTHWTNEGASVMAEAIIAGFALGGWDAAAVQEVADVDHEGDLTVLLGLPATEPATELRSAPDGTAPAQQTRPLITPAGNEYEGVVAVDLASEGGAIDGQSLVLHDSYGWALTPMLGPYLNEATFIAETDPAAGHLRDDMARAERIIHVSVQRSLHEIILGKDLAASFVAAYADEFTAVERGTRETGERLEPPGDNALYVVVDLAPGTESAEVAYKDVTAVLNPDSPRAAYHVGSGGTMYFAGEVDYRIVSVER